VGLGCLTRFEMDCERKRFARGANAHVSDDEAVAKMGHLDLRAATRPTPMQVEDYFGLIDPCMLVLPELGHENYSQYC